MTDLSEIRKLLKTISPKKLAKDNIIHSNKASNLKSNLNRHISNLK